MMKQTVADELIDLFDSTDQGFRIALRLMGA